MRFRAVSILAVCLVCLASCTASTQIGPLDGAEPLAIEDSAVQPVPTNSVSAALPGESVFDGIVNSVVYIEAPDASSSGSGIVIEGGWILTNAHVVDRYGQMRIGRSDGQDLGLFDVHSVDWILDLALVGPVEDAALVPMERSESADIAVGGRVLLIGFPDEDSSTPTPTLTEGIVSQRRYVALGDFPFLQVDATIAPGQSGGALVDGTGRLVGISGLEFGEGEFGLAFEADAMWPRIDELLKGGGNELPSGEGSSTLSDEVGPLRNFGFLLEVDESGSIDLEASSAADVYVDVQTLGGSTLVLSEPMGDPFRLSPADVQVYVDEQIEGGESMILSVDPGVYQVIIGSFSDQPEAVEVTATNVLRRFEDDEEGRELPTGRVVEGDFDWARDSDRWELPLVAGQSVTIVTDGIADTVLAVRVDDQIIATSDDEGLGVFGTGSIVEFTAEVSGSYVVEVGTYDQTRWGYLIEATIN